MRNHLTIAVPKQTAVRWRSEAHDDSRSVSNYVSKLIEAALSELEKTQATPETINISVHMLPGVYERLEAIQRRTGKTFAAILKPILESSDDEARH